jgi:hypothetical protein
MNKSQRKRKLRLFADYVSTVAITNAHCAKLLRFSVSAGPQWLMPVILATQEAEIRRIVVLKPAQANSS